ncbi:MAG: hypothetical protein ABIK86_07385 [candidate division WOR-3 bacterium]
MSQGLAVRPRRPMRLLVLLGTVVVLYAFLSGPNGLVSILVRRDRCRRLQHEIAVLKGRIEQKERERRWLANPDSARRLVRYLFEPESGAVSPGIGR